jgi:cobalamin biosynthetic protein CobC
MRDHGGNIGAAVARFGGQLDQWIDLSTGINRLPYPCPPLAPQLWQRLPMAEDMAALLDTAAGYYDTDAPAMVCAGAQAAIQMIPHLRPKGCVAVLDPSYNEHAAALAASGWHVHRVASLDDMAGADMAVVVNPNNPDGRSFSPAELLALQAAVGLLVVDESFGDVAPHLTMLPYAGGDNLLILRSFGKFWGLAGARLGLVFGSRADIARLHDMAGPWPVSGPALHIAAMAYGDRPWADTTRDRLTADAQRLDDLAARAGWRVLGGTPLFRLYDTLGALAAQSALARHQIWSRIFPYSKTWVRLGPPGPPDEWARLAMALAP